MDKVPKIKWGDLEDDVLIPEYRENDDGYSKSKCCGIEDDHVDEIMKSENTISMPQVYLSIPQDTTILEAANKVMDKMAPLTVLEEAGEENCKVVTEIPSKDLIVTIDGIVESENGDAPIVGKTCHASSNLSCSEAGEVLKSMTSATETSCSSTIGIEVKISPRVPFEKSEDGALVISEVSGSGLVTDRGLLHRPQGIDVEVPVSANIKFEMVPEVNIEVEVSKSQLMSVLGENESAENKERFRQRLWCFLFENLNRSIDELYLLCELECDVEQMNEAILVLEEAASDFRELKSRVEGFDHEKRSCSQPLRDGNSLNLKANHHRTHALSWEVRRMASSPHRAEILSSSLEAFKKIQQQRASKSAAPGIIASETAFSNHHVCDILNGKLPQVNNPMQRTTGPGLKIGRQSEVSDLGLGNRGPEKLKMEASRPGKTGLVQACPLPQKGLSDSHVSQAYLKNGIVSVSGKGKKESQCTPEMEKPNPKREKVSIKCKSEKLSKPSDHLTRNSSLTDKENERKNNTWKSMDAWKEKRNWEAILASPLPCSSRLVSRSPATCRKSIERTRVLHDKLMSPEKKKKTTLDMKREAEEKHARAMRIRSELENERVQRLQRTSEKLNRVNEWQAVRSMKLREGMFARHQRSESRYEAHLAQVVRRAGDESSKVSEVRFITSLNEGNKKLILRQKLHDSEMRRAEKLQVIRTKQKEDTAREEAVLERKKLLEAEKLQRLADTQRKKEEAHLRREEERKASSAAREAKAVEQLRRKEVRAKAQQEEAELLAQKLAERLSESEQRRKVYLEQIREKASMDFRDQSSPWSRRSLNKEALVRIPLTNAVDDFQVSCIPGVGNSSIRISTESQQHSLKRKIKKVRQRLMALKCEFTEPPVGAENVGMGYRAQVGAARAKIGKWLQDLQKLRQARKEGAASIGLIVGDMIKFLEGKDPELHASRQAGLLDFIASALPASHISKPEACQVTIYFLRLLRVALSLPANRSYFLVQNLLPPIIPMLSAALENYINVAASMSVPGSLNCKTPAEKFESNSEVLEGFLWIVTVVIGHNCSQERQLQMRDGLMVLVIAYHVIHRLRDLFSLYDRPQVEGSPFPSSILLSLNLLAILTSRFACVSAIDWESHVSNTAAVTKNEETNLVETREPMGGEIRISACEHAVSENFKLSPALKNTSLVDMQSFESCQLNGESLTYNSTVYDVAQDPVFDVCIYSGSETPSLSFEHPEKSNSNILNEPPKSDSDTQMCMEVTSVDSSKGMIQQHTKTHSSRKDTKGTVDGGAEQNNRLPQSDIQVVHIKHEDEKAASLNQPISFLLSAISETGLVSLPSLLTAVLLQANNRISSEQGSYILPSNFDEVATGVLKVLNNLALLDIDLLQRMLSRPDLKMEFFHLMSFLLSHCTSRWKTANDQVCLLLLESLLLLGYFSLFHHENQAVLRWGKSPTILHKLCDLPFTFFSDPELMPILAGTLMATCYGCEQNRGVVQQELNVEMLLSLIKSCKHAYVMIQSEATTTNVAIVDPCSDNQLMSESRKFQGEHPNRPNRNSRSARLPSSRGIQGSNARVGKTKCQRDHRGTSTWDEWAVKHNLPSSESSSSFMLHNRFPRDFLNRAQDFFSNV